ncbi:MAG TPA: TlpA disulfide reductase family protein, partial [bacterium]|nr:TlpA disulfide reductase family protein [bacterium]
VLFSRPAPAAGSPPPAGIRQPVPDPAFETLDGRPWRLSAQRGKILILEFWSVYCPPCREKEPRLKALQKEWTGRMDLSLVGVPVDNDLDLVRRYVKRAGINWPQLIFPKIGAVTALTEPLGIQWIETPDFWVVDAEGKLAGSFHDLDAAVKFVKRLVGEK